VEGGELGVIRGALDTLRTLRPQVLIEEHSRIYRWTQQQQTAVRLADVLRGCGYSVKHLRWPGAVDYVIGTP